MYLTFAFFQLKGSHGARAVRCCKYEIRLFVLFIPGKTALGGVVLFSIAELHLSKSKVVHHFDAKLGEQSGGAIRAAAR